MKFARTLNDYLTRGMPGFSRVELYFGEHRHLYAKSEESVGK